MKNPEITLKPYRVLLERIVSEKTVRAESECCYVFKVASWANKQDIQHAIELLYQVGVKSVRVLNQMGKTKRARTGMGKKSDFKKAYVTLKDGQVIQSFTVSGKTKEEG